MPRERDRDEPWLKETELFGTFFNAYRLLRSAAGQDIPEWEFIDEENQAAFQAAFQRCCYLVELSAEEPVKADDLGAATNQAFQEYHRDSRGAAVVDWESVPRLTRLVWEHAARHLFNMMEFDKDGEDGTTGEHEERIVERFLQVAARENLVAP
jgi:hypothetical protein